MCSFLDVNSGGWSYKIKELYKYPNFRNQCLIRERFRSVKRFQNQGHNRKQHQSSDVNFPEQRRCLIVCTTLPWQTLMVCHYTLTYTHVSIFVSIYLWKRKCSCNGFSVFVSYSFTRITCLKTTSHTTLILLLYC